MTAALTTILLSLLSAVMPAGTDWPQWRGPERNGVSAETGLLAQWPAGGPATLWSTSGLGKGYGAVAVKGDRIYVQGAQGSQSVVFALNLADGKVVWMRPLGKSFDQERGGGPRGTPTVDGDHVFALSEAGDLACLQAKDGTVVWARNILADFGGSNIEWLISESPLVDGGRVYVTPGGSKGGVVALDQATGKTVWAATGLTDPAGYASCIAVDVQGVRTIVTLTSRAGVGLRASDGKVMWRYTKAANDTANVATPVFSKDKVFYTSAYDTGAALLGLTAAGGEVKAAEVYFTREMMNHHGGVVLVNGYLYGFSNAILVCIEFETGKVMWRNRSVGKGSLTYADGHLYLVGEANVVGLAEASPAGYVENGRFRIADQGWPSWAHPVVSGGKLYIRNQGILASYDVKAR
jgi:outer membrane protein assembly factor BamB